MSALDRSLLLALVSIAASLAIGCAEQPPPTPLGPPQIMPPTAGAIFVRPGFKGGPAEEERQATAALADLRANGGLPSGTLAWRCGNQLCLVLSPAGGETTAAAQRDDLVRRVIERVGATYAGLSEVRPPVLTNGDPELFRGGALALMLEANLPPEQPVAAGLMEAAARVEQRRLEALGVVAYWVLPLEDRWLLLFLPGLKDDVLTAARLSQPGLVEFVDAGAIYLEPGSIIATTLGGPSSADLLGRPTVTPQGRVFRTVLTGAQLKSAEVTTGKYNSPEVAFTMTDEGKATLARHTSDNVGKYMAVVVDKEVVSCPVVNTPITGGEGVITGKFATEEALTLAVKLRTGALPLPLKVIESIDTGPIVVVSAGR